MEVDRYENQAKYIIESWACDDDRHGKNGAGCAGYLSKGKRIRFYDEKDA